MEGLSQDRKKQKNRKPTVTIKSAESEEENCNFGEAYHERDIPLDTGYSYTILSKDWLFRHCMKNHLDVRTVLIPYPDDSRASTATDGSIVEGIGFAKIELSLFTLSHFAKEGQTDLRWTAE
jgi:hypothetical protein